MTSDIKNKYRRIPDADVGAIRILDERYDGVAISIGRVSIDGEDGEAATLSYDYDIVLKPDELNLEEDSDFNNLIGDIIVDIIETQLENDPDSLRFSDSEDWKSNIKFYSM